MMRQASVRRKDVDLQGQGCQAQDEREGEAVLARQGFGHLLELGIGAGQRLDIGEEDLGPDLLHGHLQGADKKIEGKGLEHGPGRQGAEEARRREHDPDAGLVEGGKPA